MFQSTLPTREATDFNVVGVGAQGVSIHASHARSDSINNTATARQSRFNPRFPREKRPDGNRTLMQSGHGFNPRFPREKRPRSEAYCPTKTLFQSTLPTREATNAESVKNKNIGVSIHASHARSDHEVELKRRIPLVSIHASHARSD